MAKHILKSMIRILGDDFELYAKGKGQILNLERLMLRMKKWMTIKKVETGFVEDENYMQVLFTRPIEIFDEYKRYQAKAHRIIEFKKALKAAKLRERE